MKSQNNINLITIGLSLILLTLVACQKPLPTKPEKKPKNGVETRLEEFWPGVLLVVQEKVTGAIEDSKVFVTYRNGKSDTLYWDELQLLKEDEPDEKKAQMFDILNRSMFGFHYGKSSNRTLDYYPYYSVEDRKEAEKELKKELFN